MITPDELIQAMRISSTRLVRAKLEEYNAKPVYGQNYAIIAQFFEDTARESKEDGWPSPIQNGPPKEVVLPEWYACERAVRLKKATALQKFIFKREPKGPQGTKFRELLLATLKEAAQ